MKHIGWVGSMRGRNIIGDKGAAGNLPGLFAATTHQVGGIVAVDETYYDADL